MSGGRSSPSTCTTAPGGRRALGVEPAPRVGQLTRRVYDVQLDDPMTTLEDAPLAARQLISS